MLRPLLAACLGLLSLLCFTPGAEACGESGCQVLLQKIQDEPAADKSMQASSPALAEAGDEAVVRERDRRRLEPEAPAFWMQFRSYAYKKLPKHQEENFRAVWVAMPLSTSDGTVPTLGLKGTWW